MALTDNLIHRWCPSLDSTGLNTGTLYDLAGSADATGTNIDSADWISDTGAGGTYAIDLNGSNEYYTTTFDPSSLSAFSVSVWAYFHSGGLVRYLWGCFDNPTADRFYFRRETNQTTTRIGIGSTTFTYTSTSSNSTWLHYVVTYDGTNTRLYYQGSDQGANSVSSPTYHNVNVMLGAASGDGTASSPFDGLVDDFAVWDRALSVAEVTTLYNSGSGRGLTYSSGGGGTEFPFQILQSCGVI